MTTAHNLLDKEGAESELTQAIRNYEAALRHFHKQNYEKAAEILEKVIHSSAKEVAGRARVYLHVCQRKLNRAEVVLKTAMDHYEYGVLQLNAGNLEGALEHLSRADEIEPGRDYVKYALAAGHSRAGNVERALEFLKAAITRCPANRVHARRDEDFESLKSHPRFRELVGKRHNRNS